MNSELRYWAENPFAVDTPSDLPDVVLALLDEVERLRGDLLALQLETGRWRCSCGSDLVVRDGGGYICMNCGLDAALNSSTACDCHLHEHQVCDACQGTTSGPDRETV